MYILYVSAFQLIFFITTIIYILYDFITQSYK